jgi:hypothetical protein
VAQAARLAQQTALAAMEMTPRRFLLVVAVAVAVVLAQPQQALAAMEATLEAAALEVAQVMALTLALAATAATVMFV